MYLIPSPFQAPARITPTGTSHTSVAIPGVWDTSYVSLPVHHGADSDVDSVTYTGFLEPLVVLAIPDYVENVAIVKDSTVNGIIRATAYPFWRNYESRDTLDIDVILEWNLQAAPKLEMSKVDTVWDIDSVWVPVPIPFIEKPVVVVASTLIGVAVIYTVTEFIKSLGK